MVLIKDQKLLGIWKKVQFGERLNADDGRLMFESSDLLGLGAMANWVKEKRSGMGVTFVVNRQINPTNICILSCRFCDFAKKKNHPQAYKLTQMEIVSQCNKDISEVHITSGLYNGWSFEDYLDVVRVIKKAFPHIQIKAYTAVEIDYFSRISKLSIGDVLRKMISAGVVCIPGGGAEVFSERVRKVLFAFKIGAPKWLEIHRAAHQLGLKSNSTLLYGHIETHEERVDHMMKLRALQDETHGFLSFIPLAYQPGMTKVVDRQTSAIDDLKTIAISRLMLDNFDHIKAYWVTMGEETASMALQFGADDIDGTIGEERIMHAANATSPPAMARERLAKMIRESGRIPIERNCLYKTIREFAEPKKLGMMA
jgi:aminodeoxyfutalosine synthase